MPVVYDYLAFSEANSYAPIANFFENLPYLEIVLSMVLAGASVIGIAVFMDGGSGSSASGRPVGEEVHFPRLVKGLISLLAKKKVKV